MVRAEGLWAVIGQSAGEYYMTLEMFAADFRRMFENCRIYNAPDTVYFKCASRYRSQSPPTVTGFLDSGSMVAFFGTIVPKGQPRFL